MDALSVDNLTTSYGKRAVLHGVSLRIAAGQFVGLVGVNGAGKTTLVKSILGLCRIDDGTIHLFGQSSGDESARSRVSYLPERFAPPSYCTCRDFLRLSHRLYDVKYDAATVANILERLDLDPVVLDKPVKQLSKGMTQKLGLAACFLSRKPFLILDEPMSGLDPIARHHVKQMLLDAKQRGTTVLMSSHALADVEVLCNSMTVIHQGQVVFDDTVQAFRESFPDGDLDDSFMKLVKAGAPIAE